MDDQQRYGVEQQRNQQSGHVNCGGREMCEDAARKDAEAAERGRAEDQPAEARQMKHDARREGRACRVDLSAEARSAKVEAAVTLGLCEGGACRALAALSVAEGGEGGLKGSIKHQQQALIQTPQDERPRGAVPQSTEQHGDQ